MHRYFVCVFGLVMCLVPTMCLAEGDIQVTSGPLTPPGQPKFTVKASDVDEYDNYVGELDLSNVQGDLYIDREVGLLVFNEPVSIAGNLFDLSDSALAFSGGLDITGGISSSGRVRVEGNCHAGGLFIETGDFYCTGDLAVGGDIRIGYGVLDAGNIVAVSNILVGGDVRSGHSVLSAQGRIEVTEGIWCEGQVVAGGSITAELIFGAERIESGESLYVTGSSLDVSEHVVVGGSLSVAEDIEVGDRLEVMGNIIVGFSPFVHGDEAPYGTIHCGNFFVGNGPIVLGTLVEE